MSHAARLEAEGAHEATFDFRGVAVTIPLDIAAWPVPLVRTHPLAATLALLGEQADTALGPRPLLDDARELSDAMAAAAGVARLPETPAAPDSWFGGVQTLLWLLDDYEDDVASDLKRFWGVDYADRFTGTLTLRRIWTYIRRLPATSALARAVNGGNEQWTELMYIAAAVYQALTGKVYPGRPLKPDELTRAIEAVQAQAEHEARLRRREAEYASRPGNPVAAALAEAEANRRRELGQA
jgi:hypothetical protein